MILLTFADCFDSLVAYLGAAPSTQTLRDCRQAIMEALDDITNAYTWSYFYKIGRLFTNAPFNDGSIQYQVSSGLSPYLVTLTTTDSGVFPSWTASGTMSINNVNYPVDQYLSPTTCTLIGYLAPQTDLPAGTSYQLYQDSYLLPIDFVAQDQSLYETCFGALQYVHPRDWLFQHRYLYNTGIPQNYTIDGDQKYPNRLVVRLSPLPTDTRTLDYIYKRRPRPILWQDMNQGTVSLTASSNVVTGTGTAFDQTMVGSVLRVSPTGPTSTSQNLPTWVPGNNPATFEAIIYSVTSPTILNTMPLTPSTVTYTNTAYRISDPIDVETGAMRNAFLRCCEWKISQTRIMKDKPNAKQQYLDELRRAKEADSRSFASRAEGDYHWHRMRMKDMPWGPDQPAGID